MRGAICVSKVVDSSLNLVLLLQMNRFGKGRSNPQWDEMLRLKPDTNATGLVLEVGCYMLVGSGAL